MMMFCSVEDGCVRWRHSKIFGAAGEVSLSSAIPIEYVDFSLSPLPSRAVFFVRCGNDCYSVRRELFLQRESSAFNSSLDLDFESVCLRTTPVKNRRKKTRVPGNLIGQIEIRPPNPKSRYRREFLGILCVWLVCRDL